ncbi:flagellar motor switch protein FliM [Modestobacter sp. I12A-02628]|uniref:Flagellar motor switch protein FliM n=1 Tax=Goekera deserti TaxID=2497753 RepID=A0A7K3WJ56_9ACTN|nr:flagellar motor switch protein FliM [Goekera deserti]MPQ99490.1 flagellar motor switch protein FliM [Goekera deserti]NDI48977.1 flagellar motor switch protein FliM [Goekera deserti]NEL55553.1 flagellar motor switch protein FliM [Goekera deserti]
MSRSDAVAPARGSAPPPGVSNSRARRSEPRDYDFRRPTKLSRDHVRVLQNSQEDFARAATTILTSLLRTGARMDLVGIEQHSYEEYATSLPDPYFVANFTFEPLQGKGHLAFPLDVAMATVDHMLGGSGTAEQPMRPMTIMEASLEKHLLDRLLMEMARSMEPITRIEPVLGELEYNPALAQTAVGSETVMVFSFELQVGARETVATLVLPFSSFAASLASATSPQLSESARAKRARAAEAVAARLNQVPVDVSIRFNPLEVASHDLLSLAVGDVLLLRHPKDSPLEVITNDVTFAHAIASNHRRRLAASIVPTPPAGSGPGARGRAPTRSPSAPVGPSPEDTA